MDVATLIILIVVGGVILWGALTGWTFSGIFDGRGGAKRDSPPGPISDVQLEVATGESGGRRESYTALEEMKGLSITVSFNTPTNTFGYGDLELEDYVISLGTADDNNPRKVLEAVIFISRTMSSQLFTVTTAGGLNIDSNDGITLSGDFNATDTRVSITLSDPLWSKGQIILPVGGVFLGIDYTPKLRTNTNTQYIWGDGEAAKPAGEYTRYFINGGVTLTGEVKDGGEFVVDTDVTETINQDLNIAIGNIDIMGNIDIRKQIGNESRFLISPADAPNKYLRNWLGDDDAIKVSIFAEPQNDCVLNRFDSLPASSTAFTAEFLNGIPINDFLGPESNWFNFAFIEEHGQGVNKWVRLGLISNFEKADSTGSRIKWADFPVIHPVHRMENDDDTLSFHKYDDTSNDNVNNYKTYFKFVSPLDLRGHASGTYFSLCVRRVPKTLDDLTVPLTSDDWFLTRDTNSAVLKKLKDITSLPSTVFIKRMPGSSLPTPTSPPTSPSTPTTQPVMNPCYSIRSISRCGNTPGCKWRTTYSPAAGGWSGVCEPDSTPVSTPGSDPLADYTYTSGINWEGAIVTPNDGGTGLTRNVNASECARLCNNEPNCMGFTHGVAVGKDFCWLRSATSYDPYESDSFTFYRKLCANITNSTTCRASTCNWYTWAGYGSSPGGSACVPKM